MTTQNVSELKTILTNIDQSIYAVERFISTLQFYLDDLEEFKRDHPELDPECLELLYKISTVLKYKASFLMPKLGFVYHNIFSNAFKEYVHNRYIDENDSIAPENAYNSLKNFLSNDIERDLFVLEKAGIAIQNTFLNTFLRSEVLANLQNDPQLKNEYREEIGETIDRLGTVFTKLSSKRATEVNDV